VSTKANVFIGAGVLMAAAVVWMVRSGIRPHDAAPKTAAHAAPVDSAPSDDADARELRARLDILQAQISGLQQQLADRAGNAVPAPPASSATSPKPLDDTADKKRVIDRLEQVDLDFQVETRDPRWSRNTTSEFRSAVGRSDVLQKAFQSIDCRSTTCRVEMLDDRSPEFQRALMELAHTLTATVPSMSGRRLVRPDGTAVAVYYWSTGS
jgi:hypothetical protein